MAKRMLVDATHPEETRVVVVSGHRVEEFDFETSTKKQLKGNIYLARVTRVEPSLQAAFVEYGGNRHGFLAFSEIHPDYYRIPVADRQALMAEQAREEEDEDFHPAPRTAPPAAPAPGDAPASLADALDDGAPEGSGPDTPSEPSSLAASASNIETVSAPVEPPADISPELVAETQPAAAAPAVDSPPGDVPPPQPAGTPAAPTEGPYGSPSDLPVSDLPATEYGAMTAEAAVSAEAPAGGDAAAGDAVTGDVIPPPQVPESIGGDETEEVERRRRHRPQRHYKIQEVIKRRQILLIQVVKEERGTKGAALTTYLSLAGRYCVLMPNTARGGGISRRITSAQDRRRLKQIMEELQVPEGMAVILRTAGMERSNAEIKRDYEYLMRLWDDIREMTLRSVAPCLIYEEGSLVKRAIRDIYSSDIDEILVEGEAGHESARSFMGMLMPDHVDRVRRYDDPAVPLFQRFQVESELDQIHNPTVRLRSGGYIVINQTEALVAIDVNSGRATRERHIEETAFKTNMEAAEEVARQVRLRDLAGLIVIDFIDMEEHRNQHAVERRVKDAMRSDRARIQIGRISAFGLLELSRQRLRPSLSEVSSEICAHCGGTGRVRSTESTVLHVLRGIEEEGMRLRTAEARVAVPTNVALYMLNHKREALERIEQRYGLHVVIAADDALITPAYRLDRTRPREDAAALAAAGRAAPVRADISHATPREDSGDDHGMPAMPSPDGYREERGRDERGRDEQRGRRDERGRDDRGRDDRGRDDHREGRDGRDGGEHGRGGRSRRRRRGGRDRDDRQPAPAMQETPAAPAEAGGEVPGMATPSPDSEGGPQPLVTGEAAPQLQGHEGKQGAPREGRDGDEQGGRRRRRRGRRGGRRRHGEGGYEGEPQRGGQPHTGQPQGEHRQPAPRPPIMGPGHDLPEESPFRPQARTDAPPRIEGPGDGHDWPWNRRNERFPEELPAAPLTPPSPFPATPDPVPRSETPATAAPAPVEPAPAAAEAAPPAGESPSDEPKGPPRKGWWKRLTS
jgi:ribonuclease E